MWRASHQQSSIGTAACRQAAYRDYGKPCIVGEYESQKPWVLVRFATIDAEALPGLLESAWRLVAPKALVAKLDGERSCDPSSVRR